MDAETIRNILIACQVVGGGFCAVLVHFHNDLKGKVAAGELATAGLAREVADFKFRVAEGYVTNNELAKTMDAFMKQLEATNSKLDRLIERGK